MEEKQIWNKACWEGFCGV